jgi:Phage capsid family
MSDKPFAPFSIGKAIREIVEKGILTGNERESHYQLEREAESALKESAWMRGAAGPRDIALNVPVELFTRQITTAAFPIGIETFGVSNLLTWSACLRAGATVLSGLQGNATLWSIGTLPVPQWLPELGMVAPSDPIFAGYSVSPKRVSAMLVVSNQLLRQQNGPDLERILINDLSRQLGSYLDQCALYGGGPAAHQPTGLVNVPGVAQGVPIDAADLLGSFCALEAQIEAANVSLDSYGVIVSSGTRKDSAHEAVVSRQIDFDLGGNPRRSKLAGSYR